MSAHGVRGPRTVAGADRFHDRLVFLDAKATTAERRGHALRSNEHRFKQGDEREVLRRGDQDPMQFKLGEAAFTLRSSRGGAERLHRGAEPLMVASGGTRGGQPRNLDLGDEPAFRHLSDQPLAAATGNEFGEELAIEHVPVARFGHELAASVPYYDDAAFLERAQRLPHNASANTELPLQVLLAGKPLTRLILAGDDRAEHHAHLFAMQTHRGDPIIRHVWLVGGMRRAAPDLGPKLAGLQLQ